MQSFTVNKLKISDVVAIKCCIACWQAGGMINNI